MTSASHYAPHESCQIPGLAAILESKFGFRTDGTFVEVGAFDGQSFSNTSFLADLGWRGVYVEPIPHYAAACAQRHRQNPKVSVVQGAIGAETKIVEFTVGSVLTTSDPSMAHAYSQIDWAKNFNEGRKVTAQQHRLDSILAAAKINPHFDLLVVDVEGGEEGVFNSFDLAVWRPRMMIVELEDTHPSFQAFPEIVKRAGALRQRIAAQGYSEIFRDPINTIFWHEL